MSYKSHSLNLWAVEDDATKLDIDAHTDRIDITTTGSQSVKIHPALHLVSVRGDIADVADKIHTNTQAIVDGNAGSAAASALVQSNLDAYQTSNDASVATLNATVVANKAITDAQHTSDANARATLQTDLEAKITDEETERKSDVATLNASVSQEVSDRTTAVASEATARQIADNVLTAEVAVERGRIDAILAGAGVDLDSLSEISKAYANVDANVLNQIADMTLTLNTLVSRVNALTSGSDADFVVALETAIAELDLTQSKAFLKQQFSISYDMLDIYVSATSSMLGWVAYRALLIAGSSGALTVSSTDAEVETYLLAVLNASFGANVLEGSTLRDFRLKYADYQHYLLETGLVGAKPWFKGVEQSALPSVNWRLSYCSVAGDDTSKYSTILSGTQSGKVLTISPADGVRGIEFPVNGVSGVRDGYKSTLLQLTLK